MSNLVAATVAAAVASAVRPHHHHAFSSPPAVTVFPMYGQPDSRYTDGGPGVWHGKPGVVTLGKALFAVGGITAECILGLRKSLPPHGPGSFREMTCALPPNWRNNSCELRDGPVAIGDETGDRLVMVWNCEGRGNPSGQEEIWAVRSTDGTATAWEPPLFASTHKGCAVSLLTGRVGGVGGRGLQSWEAQASV